MADSLSQKSSKSGDKSKHCLTLNRTTSETLRISEPEKNIIHPSSLSSTSGANIRKKAPSFQITSVTVGSRISNDGGDDSADDLDESHTEDMSDVVDRITDLENETPSYSEDTFSREDLFYSSALTTAAPVIPTSSQYGLAIVSEGSGGTSLNNVGANIVGDFVSVADNVMLNLSVKHAEERDPHHPHVRNERFKVVKIESTEPFKRGRWTCMDYLDHTMVQPVSGHEENLGAPGEAYHEGVVLPMSSDMFHPHAQSQIFSVHPAQQGVGNTGAGQSLPAGIVPHAAAAQQLPPAPQYYSPPSHPVTILPTDNGPTPTQHQPGSGGSVSTQTQTGHNASVSPPSSNGPGAHMIQSPIMQNTASSQPMLQQSQPGLRTVGSSGNLQQHAAASTNQQAPSTQQQQHVPQPGVQMQHQSVMQQQSNANMQQMQQQMQQQYIQQQQPQQQQYMQPQKPATTQLPPGFIHQNMNSVPQPQQGSNYPQQQQQQPQQAMSQPAGFVSANMMQQAMSVNQQPQQQMSGASQAQSYVQQPQQPVYSQPQAMSQPAGFISQTVQQPQVMSNFVPSSNQQLPPQQPVNYMPVTNTVQQQQLPSSVPQPVSQPSLVNHTPTVMPNTVHVTAGQNYMPQHMSTQSSIPSMQQQQHQQPVQVQNSMPSMPQQPVQNSMPPMPQQPLQVQNSMPSMPQQAQSSMQQHQQPGQTQNSMQQQHQQSGHTQSSMQQHQQPVQPQSSMPQQHQPVQTQNSMPQQHQQPVQTQNSMPQQHQQPVQTQNSMPQQHQQPVQTQNSMPQQHQQPVQTQNSMPQQHQQPVQNQNSMPQQHQQQPVQVQNSMPQQPGQIQSSAQSMPQHQQPVPSQNSMPQQHPVQTQSSMPQQHPVQMVNHQPGQSYSHHPVAPLVSNSSSQTVTAQSYSHPLNVNVPQQAVPARTAPAPLVITNGSPMSTPHMEPASHQDMLNVGVLEPHLLESLADVATSMGTGASEEQPATGEDAESSSGTSAVAIDNKIEQAMDLVKSHLMFAVREEVEVLKEKIVELTGRINQLEYENTVLKAHATQETLQQLSVPLPQQLPQQAVPLQQQQQAPAPQAAPAPATMMGGGGGKAQQAPTSVS